MSNADIEELNKVEDLLEEIIFDLVNLEPFWLGVNDDDEDTAFKIKELRAKYRRYLSNVE